MCGGGEGAVPARLFSLLHPDVFFVGSCDVFFPHPETVPFRTLKRVFISTLPVIFSTTMFDTVLFRTLNAAIRFSVALQQFFLAP